MPARLLILCLCCLPLACGFHLRGAIQLPDIITPLYVDPYSVDSDLSRELRALLSQSDGSMLAATREQAAAELSVVSAQRQRRVIAVDDRGRVRQYELEYRLVYRVSGNNLPTQQATADEGRALKLKRDLLFDPDSVLAIDHEQGMLYEDMRQDAARLILQQLKAIGKSAPGQQTNDESGAAQ